MTSIRELYNRVKAANDQIDDLVVKSLEDNEELMLTTLKEQLRTGTGGDGNLLPRYKSGEYADFKSDLPTYKAPYPTADLFVTGDWSAGLTQNVFPDEVITESTDDKHDDLTERYGSDKITEIEPKRLPEIKQKNNEKLIKYWRNAAKL